MVRSIEESRLEDIILDVLFGSDNLFGKCYDKIKESVRWLDHTPEDIINDGFSVEDAEAIVRDKIEDEFLKGLQESILREVRIYEVDPVIGKEQVFK